MNKMVYLAGGGPGDPGLITVKAMNLILEADCIIYDYLVNDELLRDSSAEKIYVGKQGSNHTLTQDQINNLLVEKGKEFNSVLRLKGGDPFIYGRGGEEAQVLREAGLSFEIVPGISSFYAAPAYAGIPITHRDCASAFEVITGHRRADASEEEDVNFPEYDDNRTFAFLMGVKNLPHITKSLIEKKNFPSDTGVAVVSRGTTPRQRTVTGTLKTICDIVVKEKITAPAIIVVGSVVHLREELQWFENRPLWGKKIVVTRSRAQASKISKSLSLLGAEVVEFPTLEIVAAKDMSPLHEAIEYIDSYDRVVFTSQNAVNIFFDELFLKGKDVRALGSLKIAAIGPATADELKKFGLIADLVPDKYVAEGLLEKMIDVANEQILLPCSAQARMTLKEGLEEKGATVNRVEIYSAEKPALIDEKLIHSVSTADFITFASSSTVHHFFDIIKNTDAELASIGPITSQAIIERKKTISVEAAEYTIPGLVKALVDHCSEGKSS